MKKTHAKFHNDPYKTVRGVALTRGIHCVYILRVKMTKFTIWKKVTKNDLIIISSKPHAHPHTMEKTHANFKTISTKLKGSCANKRYLLSIY